MTLQCLIEWAKRVEKTVKPFNEAADVQIEVSVSPKPFIVAIWENERFEIYIEDEPLPEPKKKR